MVASVAQRCSVPITVKIRAFDDQRRRLDQHQHHRQQRCRHRFDHGYPLGWRGQGQEQGQGRRKQKQKQEEEVRHRQQRMQYQSQYQHRTLSKKMCGPPAAAGAGAGTAGALAACGTGKLISGNLSRTLHVTAWRCSAGTCCAMYLPTENYELMKMCHAWCAPRHARSRLHALAGSSVHHSSPHLRVRLRREHVARVGVQTAEENVGVAVVCITAHVQAPSAEVSAAAQPWHVASSMHAATLQ